MMEEPEDRGELKRSRGGRGGNNNGKNAPKHLLKVGRDVLAQRVRAAGGLKGLPIVTIDFESYFAVQPSEVALACVVLGEGGAVQHVAQFHAFVAPGWDPEKLTADQRSSMKYVQSRVTGIPFEPALPAARKDYGALLAEILAFVKVRASRNPIVFSTFLTSDTRPIGSAACQGVPDGD
jgi:hypothetical protein